MFVPDHIPDSLPDMCSLGGVDFEKDKEQDTRRPHLKPGNTNYQGTDFMSFTKHHCESCIKTVCIPMRRVHKPLNLGRVLFSSKEPCA